MPATNKERARALVARRPLVSVLVALAIGVVVAGAAAAAVISSKSDQIADLQSEHDRDTVLVEEANSDRKDAVQRAEAITDRKAEIIRHAKDRGFHIVEDSKGELAATKEELRRAKRKLDSTQGKLQQVSASLEDAKRTKQLSSFGDGTWKSGVDFLPGTYRASGGKACYWATLNSANTSDIGDNNISPGPQIVTITTPYFQSDGCGQWHRVGG